jgi:hypothetical protein
VTQDRPIIVAGFPRSGTTMLQLMLHAHPRLAIPPETRFVLEGYQRRHSFGDLRDPARRRELAAWIVSKKTFRDLGLAADEITGQIVAAPPTLGSAYAVVFRGYARRFGKPRWGDKRPAYLQNLDVMKALFPDAQVVNIVRDGRDAVSSLLEMPWNKSDIYHAVASWNIGVDRSRAAARRLGPDSFYELRYEKLVADPEAELRGLCAFLGEEFDPVMTEPANVATTAVPKRKAWHERTHSAVTKARVGRWHDRLEPWQAALCETAMSSRLRSLGYELSGAPRPPARHLMRYLVQSLRGPLSGPKRAAVRAVDKVRGAPALDCRIDPAESVSS